jgi:hypothetical protein
MVKKALPVGNAVAALKRCMAGDIAMLEVRAVVQKTPQSNLR